MNLMIKIISKKNYKKLKEKEKKYDELIGQTITFWTGERSRYKALLSLSKEELVHRLLDINNVASRLQKELLRKEKG